MIGLALFTLISIGIRLLMMMTIQQRRERLNRQINERLRVLIAAYKTLGGSFTGNLSVSPMHRRDLRQRTQADQTSEQEPGSEDGESSDRTRRIRDAVEAALSDILLLGTEDHVRLAGEALRELTTGNPVNTHELVVSLRDFIRKALNLDPIPTDVQIPMQGPTRPSTSGGRGKGEGGGGRGGGGGMGMGGMGGSGVGGRMPDAEDQHRASDI